MKVVNDTRYNKADVVKELTKFSGLYGISKDNILLDIEGSLLAFNLIQDVEVIRIFVKKEEFWKLERPLNKVPDKDEELDTFYYNIDGIIVMMGPYKFAKNLRVHESFAKYRGFKTLSTHHLVLAMVETDDGKYKDYVRLLMNTLPRTLIYDRYKVQAYLEKHT